MFLIIYYITIKYLCYRKIIIIKNIPYKIYIDSQTDVLVYIIQLKSYLIYITICNYTLVT